MMPIGMGAVLQELQDQAENERIQKALAASMQCTADPAREHSMQMQWLSEMSCALRLPREHRCTGCSGRVSFGLPGFGAEPRRHFKFPGKHVRISIGANQQRSAGECLPQ